MRRRFMRGSSLRASGTRDTTAAGESGTANTTWFIRKPKTLGVFGGWACGLRACSGVRRLCAERACVPQPHRAGTYTRAADCKYRRESEVVVGSFIILFRPQVDELDVSQRARVVVGVGVAFIFNIRAVDPQSSFPASAPPSPRLTISGGRRAHRRARPAPPARLCACTSFAAAVWTSSASPSTLRLSGLRNEKGVRYLRHLYTVLERSKTYDIKLIIIKTRLDEVSKVARKTSAVPAEFVRDSGLFVCAKNRRLIRAGARAPPRASNLRNNRGLSVLYES
ncbi:hypothetical protein EVAR_96664_1 [Eumeta japonica]|uniref:Uncharacterized protein n=1 Tax=Eumeta variegata TaxID=151549 RepID=A0A4C1WGB2_EUMVA|nr:hypothetical protein EVAR_96664_1 [Eumeta japonica]